MSARDRILERLRAAPSVPVAAPALPAIHLLPEATTTELQLEQFRQGVEAFHGEVIDARVTGWRAALAAICAAKNIRTLLLPPAEPAELDPWPGGPQLARFDQAIEAFKQRLFDATDAGLTIAGGAIADTGTLIHADPGRMPRTLSLVPPIHICLLDVRRLHASLRTAMRSSQWAQAMPSNLIFITGPSKTADIQQTLAYGAHGPRELIVLLTEDL